jgi:hypothetical protein
MPASWLKTLSVGAAVVKNVRYPICKGKILFEKKNNFYVGKSYVFYFIIRKN